MTALSRLLHRCEWSRTSFETTAKPGSMNTLKLIRVLIARLEDQDASVRAEALRVFAKLGKVEPGAILPKYSSVFVVKLGDGTSTVRQAAMQILSQLEGAVLTPFAQAFEAKLDDPETEIRLHAFQTLQRLDTTALSKHVDRIVDTLDDSDESVKTMAARVLLQLDTTVLAPHVPAFVAKLTDTSFVGSSQIATHSEEYSMDVLHDGRRVFCHLMVEMLAKFDRAVLSHYAAQIAADLSRHGTPGKYHSSAALLQTLWLMGADTIALYVTDIIDRLDDCMNCHGTQEAVINLKKLNTSVLESHAPRLAAMIDKESVGMATTSALHLLEKFDTVVLEPHVAAVVGVLEYGYDVQVESALQILQRFNAAVIAPYAPDMAALIDNDDVFYFSSECSSSRDELLKVLAKLDANTLGTLSLNAQTRRRMLELEAER